MSQFKDAALGDTTYFWFAANLTTGAAGDGASPLFDVRLAGAAADAAPVLSGTPTLLSHADYTDGLFEIAIAATEGNGFATGNEYAVFCSLTISTVNPAGFVGSFKLVASGDTLHAGMATLMDRILGTLDTGTHKPQSGDAYGKVNDATIGLSNIKTLIDAISGVVGHATYGNAGIKTLLDAVAGYVDTEVAAIKAKTDNLPASPANEATLTTIASYIDTEVAAIKAKTDNLPSDPADQSAVEAAITSAVSGLATADALATVAGYVDTEVAAIKAKTDNLPASPANESTLATIASYIDTEVAAIKAKTDNLPSDPADQSAVEAAITAATSGLATAANLATMAGYVDTEVAAIKSVTDKLDTAMELDGEVYRLTVNALEMSPAGEGGGNTIIFPVMQGQVYTATAGQYYAEIELRRGESKLTAMQYLLTILEDVIK